MVNHGMPNSQDHVEATAVAIAVVTYRRVDPLSRLLVSLQAQVLESHYVCRIVVVDNDPDGSAAEAVIESTGPHPVTWVLERDPGIPAARQRSVELTRRDDLVVFIDDDEQAPDGWLCRLLATMDTTGADVVTGPVQGILPPGAPRWAHYSDVYSSVGKHRTGAKLSKAYTNNTVVRRRVLDTITPAFHDSFRFTGSSDLHFFLRVAKAGFTIVWDDEAVVTEYVPEARLTLGWLLRRAFRSGAGDSISRRLISPTKLGFLVSLGLAIARVLNGLLLILAGLASPRLRIRGIRRVASGIGSFAGLVGVNYEEYRRMDSTAREDASPTQ